MSGKELFIRFTARAFRKLLSIYVFSSFPFGFEGRIWDLIVSVPDHCLSFYFEVIIDCMPVLVICKFSKDLIKDSWAMHPLEASDILESQLKSKLLGYGAMAKYFFSFFL